MPRFSVIIPLYNKAPYVGKTVESVLGQTFGDYELIIVDNGSNDGSHEIVAAFTDHRIKIVRLEENVGVSNARNKGVAMASAPIVTFLDADDWWEPTFLEEMAGLIERHPDAGIYGTGYYIVKNGKKRLAPIGVDEGFEEGEINYCAVYAKTLCMPLTSITVAMPKAVFDETGGFNAFIPLKFRARDNALAGLGEVSREETLRTFAIARLALDNIPHIKAYWPMLGKDLALEAMAWGADDLDGTINDSTRIYSLAGAEEQRPAFPVQELRQRAEAAGWKAVERDSFYKIIS